jgi:hypothetical protein
MTALSFKEFNDFIEEEYSLLEEGVMDFAKALAAAIGRFVAKFSRQPTAAERDAIRKALRAKLDAKEKAWKEREAAKNPLGVKPSGTTSAAAQGAAAEREWVRDLLADQEGQK